MVEKHLPQLPHASKSKGSKTAIVYRQRTDNWDGYSESQTLTPTRSTSPFQTHLSPYPTPPQSSLRRPSDPPSISSTPSRDQESLSRKKGLWNKLSTSPAPPSPSAYPPSPAPDSMNELGATCSSIPPSPGLAKKRSSGQLLSNLNRGLSRVGSVIKRSSSSSGPHSQTLSSRPVPKRQGSKLGLSSQGSIRRQVAHGSWRGRKLADGPEAVQEEDEDDDVQRDRTLHDVRRSGESDSGDEGIGKPFNVNHDLHISPDLENLPTEWISQLKAQGMTEGDLLMIASARKRQAAGKQKAVGSASPDKEEGLPPSGFIPLKNGIEKKLSTVRKSEQANGLPQRQRSYKSSTSPSSTKQRLPALMHLDDTRPSLDMTPAQGSGPSRSSSVLTFPPSAFSSGSRPAPSRRLSDQLRGFASLNLDEVGSWADDVIDVMQQSQGDMAKNGSEGLKINAVAAELGAKDKRLASPRSPRSHGVIKRVPVPPVEGAQKSVDEATFTRAPEIGHTDQALTSGLWTPSNAPRQPIAPGDHAIRHIESGVAGSDVMSTPKAPNNTMMASHSHSQSLSTAEDQEIRTPSTAEDDHAHTAAVPLYPRPEGWRSTEGMGQVLENEKKPLISSCSGKLGEAINLSPTDRSRPFEDLPSTPTQPTSTYLTLNSPSRPSLPSPAANEADFSLSFPSPLRPPPNPHVSLPASASDTDDNFSRPMSFSGVDPDASPILRGGVLSIGSDLMSCGSEDWGSRKASGASEPRRGSGNEAAGVSENGGLELAYRGKDVEGDLNGGSGVNAQTKPGTNNLPSLPPKFNNDLPEPPKTDYDSEEDHLSPLPPPLTHHPLSHRTSARSLTATERESMALSTFSGESDADYSRDSMLGARVYTAQKCEVGRMSVFSSSGYMEEEGGELGQGEKREG